MVYQPDEILSLARGPGFDLPEPAARRLADFARLLLWWTEKANLIGPRARARLWEDHLSEAIWLSRQMPPEGLTADLGTGAGLPGLALACLDPGRNIELFEARAKKVSFLKYAAVQLDLTSVKVHQVRVESDSPAWAGGRFDLVVSRAAAPLAEILPPAAWLLRPGGRFFAVKGPGAEIELNAVRPELADRGWDYVGTAAETRFGREVRLVKLVKNR